MKEKSFPIDNTDRTGKGWETNPKLSGPTVKIGKVEVEVEVEPGGMVEEAIKLGGKIRKIEMDTSDRKN